MDERRESGETNRGSGLGWRLWAYYVNAGAVVALLKAALLVWADHYQGAAATWNVHWAFYPEAIVIPRIAYSVIGSSRMAYYVVVPPLLAIGSYAIATPVLVVGWLMLGSRLGRRVVLGFLTTGTALAILRVAVLVSLSGPDGMSPTESLRWTLYPELLISVHTPFELYWPEAIFVYGTLLAVGSYVMATPILLVGWLARRRRGTVEADKAAPTKEPAPSPLSRPRVVTVAVLLYYAAGIGFLFGVTHADSRTILLTGLFMAFIVMTVHYCALGHCWARIALVINGAVSFLIFEGIVFDVAQAGRPIGLERGLHQAITPAMYAVTVVASSLLLAPRARGWCRGGKPHTGEGSSPRTISWITVAVLLSLPVVAGTRYLEWNRHTLPADVVVEMRKQLEELRRTKATLEDLVARLETDPDFLATLPSHLRSPGVAADSTASAYIKSLKTRIENWRVDGHRIYHDVRTRWPQLSVRQRFEAASLIGNALGVNAEFYRFRSGWPDEGRGLLEGRGLFELPAYEVSDTSQNLPDPR